MQSESYKDWPWEGIRLNKTQTFNNKSVSRVWLVDTEERDLNSNWHTSCMVYVYRSALICQGGYACLNFTVLHHKYEFTLAKDSLYLNHRFQKYARSISFVIYLVVLARSIIWNKIILQHRKVLLIKGSTWLLAIIYFCINICDTHRDITAVIFHSQRGKKRPFCTSFLWDFWVTMTAALKLSSVQGNLFCLFLWQRLMKHEPPVRCSSSLQFVFSATTFLMTSVHPAFLPIFSKWNFTKGLADRGKLNHAPPKWDASTPQLFSYRESLSSLLQKEAAILPVSVPQTNPQSRKQHDLCCRFLFHIWNSLGLISRMSKVGLVLCDLC